MRITTWNVNGLRAALGKGLFNSIHDLMLMFCVYKK